MIKQNKQDFCYQCQVTHRSQLSFVPVCSPEPVEEPVATGDVISHPTHTAQTTTSHYFGLPYQVRYVIFLNLVFGIFAHNNIIVPGDIIH